MIKSVRSLLNEANNPLASQKGSVSLKDIQDAKYASSFMRDRAQIRIDGRVYTKIGKNEWQHMPLQANAIGGIFSDKEIYDKVISSKDYCLDESVQINEKLNLDSDGKRLKSAISRIVVDSDDELREFVSAIVEEVIKERR